MVDVGLDDEVLSVLGLDDDGDLGDLNDLDKFSAKHTKCTNLMIIGTGIHSASLSNGKMRRILNLVLTKFHHVVGWLVVQTGR